jgi:glycosyltransferase involved in cell wall biosynthesis
VNGFLYPPGNVALLAAALAELAHDATGRAAMGRASRKIIAGHDIRHTLDAFEDLYSRGPRITTQSRAGSGWIRIAASHQA